MPRYAAFLRGVMPMNCKMAALKAAFEAAGFTDVKTVASSRSEERRVGKECRSRWSWSSDVFSSDLGVSSRRHADELQDGGAESGIRSCRLHRREDRGLEWQRRVQRPQQLGADATAESRGGDARAPR